MFLTLSATNRTLPRRQDLASSPLLGSIWNLDSMVPSYQIVRQGPEDTARGLGFRGEKTRSSQPYPEECLEGDVTNPKTGLCMLRKD